MTTRDASLVEIRPELAIDTEAASALELFQSRTIRPILTLQNPVMLTLLSYYLKKYCPRFSQFDRSKRISYVSDMLKRDSRPKNMIVGMVAGHFTEDEFAFFVDKEPEVRRCLIDLCILALQDQIDRLCSDAPSA